MEYKVKGFTVYGNDFSDVEKWINEMTKEGFEVDSWKTQSIGNGLLAERVIVMMKKKQAEITVNLSAQAEQEIDAEEMAKKLEEKVKETKSKSKSKE